MGEFTVHVLSAGLGAVLTGDRPCQQAAHSGGGDREGVQGRQHQAPGGSEKEYLT